MQISKFTDKINIGDAYKTYLLGNSIYGRIVGFDKKSASYQGEYARVVFATPAGSVLRVGRAYLEKLSDQDLEILTGFENSVKAQGEPLYDGQLDEFSS